MNAYTFPMIAKFLWPYWQCSTIFRLNIDAMCHHCHDLIGKKVLKV